MGKHNKDKEYDLLQRLKKENEKLKKQLGTLRKQLARVNLDDYSNLKELVEKHYGEDQLDEQRDLLEKLKEEWKCFECGNGYLQLIIINRRDGLRYLRKCTFCNHRTKTKRYNENVKGIKD